MFSALGATDADILKYRDYVVTAAARPGPKRLDLVAGVLLAGEITTLATFPSVAEASDGDALFRNQLIVERLRRSLQVPEIRALSPCVPMGFFEHRQRAAVHVWSPRRATCHCLPLEACLTRSWLLHNHDR